MSFKRHGNEIRSRTSLSQTHIFLMRPGLTGIRKIMARVEAWRGAGLATMRVRQATAFALTAMTLTLAACDAGAPRTAAVASAAASTVAGGSASSAPVAASAVQVAAHEAGKSRAQVYESVR